MFQVGDRVIQKPVYSPIGAITNMPYVTGTVMEIWQKEIRPGFRKQMLTIRRDVAILDTLHTETAPVEYWTLYYDQPRPTDPEHQTTLPYNLFIDYPYNE